MKAIVIKAFKDKITTDILSPGQIIEITEERFSELTAEPSGIFVKEIKEIPKSEEPPNQGDKESVEPPENYILDLEKMTKAEISEYASKGGIELNMRMTKAEMIEFLLKK